MTEIMPTISRVICSTQLIIIQHQTFRRMISVFIQKYNIIVVFYIYYLYIMDIIDLLLILAIIYIIIDLSKKRNKGKTPPKMEKMSDGGYIKDLFEAGGVIDGSCYEIPTRDNKVKPRFLEVFYLYFSFLINLLLYI